MPLSDTAIQKIKPKAKPFKVADGGGLFLLVHPSGNKWWRYKYRFGGKKKLLALGSYPEISLAMARESHFQVRKALAAGNDPAQLKQEAKRLTAVKEENTFEVVAREWHKNRLSKWTPSHGKKVLRRLEVDAFPQIGSRPIAEITSLDLLDVLHKVESRGALELAHRVLQMVGQVFTYALVTQRVGRNPATDLRGALTPVVKQNHAYLKADDLPEFLNKLKNYDGQPQTRLAVKFLLLTFVRTSELRGTERSDPNGG
jgi:hypothetical protein